MTGSTNALSKKIYVNQVVEDNLTATKGTYSSFTIDLSSILGTPIGIVGLAIDNATTDGGGASFCFPYYFVIDGTNAKVYVRNTRTTDDSKIKITLDVLVQN